MPDPLAPPGTDRNSVPLRTARSTDDNRQDALHIDRHQFLPTEAALRIEGLCGQPEKMADGARVVRDFQPPFGAVSKPRDGVARIMSEHAIAASSHATSSSPTSTGMSLEWDPCLNGILGGFEMCNGSCRGL